MVTSATSGKLRRRLLRDFGVARPVIVRRDHRLRRGRVEKFEERLRGRTRAFPVDDLVDNRHRRLREDRDARHHNVEPVLAELVDCEIGLVFPRQQHVADAALDECHRRAAGAGVEDRDVGVERLYEIARFILAAVFLQRVTPCGEIVPARAARGLRIWRDDFDARFHQVVPILDAFRIALAHQEHDGRSVGRGIRRQALLPVRRDQPAIGDGVDVVGESERHDVGLKAVDHRARLRAGTAVGCFDRQRLAGIGLVPDLEGLAETGVKLPRRIVGNIKQAQVGCGRRAGHQSQKQKTRRHAFHCRLHCRRSRHIPVCLKTPTSLRLG